MKIPGKRAQELSFYITKFKQNFAYDRITMITIDQLKAAMSLKSQFQPDDEKTVGVWRNTKTATGVYSYQHAVSQWLFFSKGADVNPAKYPDWGIDGWIVNIITEKNKATSSKHEISIIFDKRNGIDKFWSEFLFISSHCPSEVKLTRANIDIPYPLAIKGEGAWSVLEVVNPETGEIEYTSKKFYKKTAKKLYEEDAEFHKWFDIAVDYSCIKRISQGLLKVNMNKFSSYEEIDSLDETSPENSEAVIMDSLPIENGISNFEDITEPSPIVTEQQSKKRGRKKKTDDDPAVLITDGSSDDAPVSSTYEF